MTDLAVGTAAPDFSLPSNGGGTVSLADFTGKPLVIYFYPKDSTPACTTEAIDFTALSESFAKAGAAIVGVSPDSVKSHDKFAAKHNLSVILAADEEHRMLEAYGVWKEKSMYGKTYMGVERTTVLIDATGKIVQIWPKVKVAGHAEAVLQAVRALG
ncbi:alkyl hydroperoxide reductase/ Thiol specific antioxidant/ Mal allergen [Rhizobium sp. PDO1-076]|uniref:thioredoxin-dependent thiol peroxidase n=1 Tax=Rhizobium sp. PDO1-076 TaxID=1125979 RepID=UPI00024E323A|nr:thioredoxin-dependent thiol peroxidase [Rhizobium sp. PDO1-076]EHS52224.1 alkyl hydroperoxide reductase/ Thiol specific antioxidant/ Mal allergen [Rhizobium sp. PDO1-076]